MNFDKILSHPSVLAFLAEQKIKEATTIQSLVIPDFLTGNLYVQKSGIPDLLNQLAHS